MPEQRLYPAPLIMLARIFIVLLVIIAWLAVFCLGAFIDTNPLRQGLQDNFNLADFLFIILAWIPTNIAFLSILAGLMGALSRGLLRQVEEAGEAEAKKNRALGGSIAGFMFYMAFMAGAFVMMDQPFTNTTEAQYYRIAGSISFVSFIAGFRPDTLRRILEKIPGF
ncbi:MAG: hypothetical protein DYG98_07900 [Haliscomenobacteraceae bacterium CHB4]|nr:hypothetical protein [Saprospiraceae bacterium]MCE7922966.1 hypothetical protein [Haliscomenobacteraceae bacterium CHB4]